MRHADRLIMKTYTFQTVSTEYLGSTWGIQTFTVQAESKSDAWDAVRKLTSFVLTIVSVEENR